MTWDDERLRRAMHDAYGDVERPSDLARDVLATIGRRSRFPNYVRGLALGGFGAALAAAVLMVASLSGALGPESGTAIPSVVAGLPSELVGRTWLTSDEGQYVVGLLGSDISLSLPRTEAAIVASDGVVVSVRGDGGNPHDGRHIVVRRIADGTVLAEADVGFIVLWAAIATDQVFLVGGPPQTPDAPAVVPGLWSLPFGGRLQNVVPTAPAPTPLADLRLSRLIVLSPDRTKLLASLCRSDGFDLRTVRCDFQTLATATNALTPGARDVHGTPIAFNGSTVVLSSSDALAVAAVDASTGAHLWEFGVASIGAGYVHNETSLVQVYGDPSGSEVVARVNLADGSRSPILTAPSGQLGALAPSLSGPNFAVFFSASDPIPGPGSRIRVLDFSSGTFLGREFSLAMTQS